MATFVWPAKKFALVHIPKTGGTSLSIGIASPTSAPPDGARVYFLLGQDRSTNTVEAGIEVPRLKLPQTPYESRLNFDEHLTVAQLSRLFRLDDWLVLAIVRNPWDRFVSSWWAAASRQGLLWDCQQKPHTMSHGFSMEGYMARLDNCDLPHDHFFAPQVDWTHIDGERVCVVRRYEHLAIVWEWLKQKLDLPLDRVLPWARRQDHENYRSYYTPETRDWVAKRYARDIEEFGYEF